MFKTSLVLSLLSAMLGVDGSSTASSNPQQNKVQEIALAVDSELTDKQRIEAEARKNVAQSLVND